MALPSAAEKQRRYRARRDSDPERRKQYLAKEREKWRRDIEEGRKMECTRGGFCNFMHLKPISRELRRELYGRRKKRHHSRSRSRDRRSRSRDRGRKDRDRRRSRDRERYGRF